VLVPVAGYQISREYAVDPLERLSVGDVMTTELVTVPASMPIRDLMTRHFFGGGRGRHPGYPVVNRAGRLLGVITRSNFLDHWADALLGGGGGGVAVGAGPIIAYDLIDRPAVTAYPGESCRAAAERMAGTGVKRLPSSPSKTPTACSASSRWATCSGRDGASSTRSPGGSGSSAAPRPRRLRVSMIANVSM
jgi:hypothetical protein